MFEAGGKGVLSLWFGIWVLLPKIGKMEAVYLEELVRDEDIGNLLLDVASLK